jgi:DNA-binding MarR family transcriptional regulator
MKYNIFWFLWIFFRFLPATARNKIMELTFRQKVFLSKFLDDYKERQGSIHYSEIAKRMGLNNSTAYDMLRLLEKKGMITSEYGTPKENAGPGRSNIRFVPTTEAIELISNLAGDVQEQDDWDDVKARIMANLSKFKSEKYQEIIDELLAMIPEPQSSLAKCAEIIAAMLLNLREARQELSEQKSVDILLKAPASKLRMSILSGLILGLSHADQRTRRLLVKYQEYAEKYQAALQDLNRDSLQKLHRFTRDVWKTLKLPAH